MVWYFIGVYIINRTSPLGDTKFLFSCFSIREEKFRISSRPCNILYLLHPGFSGVGRHMTSRCQVLFPPLSLLEGESSGNKVALIGLLLHRPSPPPPPTPYAQPPPSPPAFLKRCPHGSPMGKAVVTITYRGSNVSSRLTD